MPAWLEILINLIGYGGFNVSSLPQRKAAGARPALIGTQRNVRRSGEERLRFTRSPICAPAPTCAAVARGVAGARHRPEGIVVA